MDRSTSRVCRPGKRPGRAGARGELLNPLVRRLVYNRLPNDNDKGGGGDGCCRTAFSSSRTPISAPMKTPRSCCAKQFSLCLAQPVRLASRRPCLGRSPRRANVEDARQGQAQRRAASRRIPEGGATSGTQLNSAQLQGADLSKAQLQGAELSYANLQGADLSGAQLQGADLSGANLQALT